MKYDANDSGPVRIARLLSALVGSPEVSSWFVICTGHAPMIITVNVLRDGVFHIEQIELQERVRELGRPFKKLTGRLVALLYERQEAQHKVILQLCALLSTLLGTWGELLQNCKAPDNELGALFLAVERMIWVDYLERDLLNEDEFGDCLQDLQLLVARFVLRCQEEWGDSEVVI